MSENESTSQYVAFKESPKDEEAPEVKSPNLGRMAANTRYKYFLFDSVCSNFHFQVFVEQIIAHLVVPLAPLFVNVRAQGFYRWGFFPILFNIVIPSTVYIMIVSYFMSSNKDLGVLQGAIWVPLLFFLQHRMTVALKYATLSVSEYRKFQNCRDLEISSKYASQMELLQNWTTRDEELINFELGCAAVRSATKLNEIFFVIHNPDTDVSSRNAMEHWDSFAQGRRCTANTITAEERNSEATGREGVKSPLSALSSPSAKGSTPSEWASVFSKRKDGFYCISVHDLTKLIILRCDCKPESLLFLRLVGLSVILLVTILPFIQVARHHIPATPSIVLFLIFSTFLNWFMGSVYIMLLVVVIKDAVRHVNMIEFLHSLIRLTDLRLNMHFSIWSPRFVYGDSDFFLKREDGIAHANFELIQSLTEWHTPEDAQRNTLAGFSLEDTVSTLDDDATNDGSSSPAFLSRNSNSWSSSTSSWKNEASLSGKTTGPRHRRYSSKKSSVVGELVVSRSSAAIPELSLLPIHHSASGNNMSTINEDGVAGGVMEMTKSDVVPAIAMTEAGQTTDEATTKPRQISRSNGVAQRNFGKPPLVKKPSESKRAAPHVKKGKGLCMRDLEFLLRNAYSKMPRLDMNIPENVSAWMACRLAVQHFGERFRMRTEFYVMGNSIVVVAFMVSVLTLLLTSKNREHVFSSVYLLQSCLLIALSFTYIIILASFYALGNSQLAQHQRTLSSHALRMRHELVQIRDIKAKLQDDIHDLQEKIRDREHEPVEEEATTTSVADDATSRTDKQECLFTLNAQLKQAQEKLTSIQDVMEQVQEALEGIESSLEMTAMHTELKPLQLLGFRAESSLVFSIVTTAASFFLVVLSLYSDSVANAGSALV